MGNVDGREREREGVERAERGIWLLSLLCLASNCCLARVVTTRLMEEFTNMKTIYTFITKMKFSKKNYEGSRFVTSTLFHFKLV